MIRSARACIHRIPNVAWFRIRTAFEIIDPNPNPISSNDLVCSRPWRVRFRGRVIGITSDLFGGHFDRRLGDAVGSEAGSKHVMTENGQNPSMYAVPAPVFL